MIELSSGEMFQGLFTRDMSYCQGKLFSSPRSERVTEGTWSQGRLTGLARIDNEFGGCEECFFIDGVRHGVAVEFGPCRRKHFMRLSWYDNGVARGTAIKGQTGGVLIFGRVSTDSKGRVQ